MPRCMYNCISLISMVFCTVGDAAAARDGGQVHPLRCLRERFWCASVTLVRRWLCCWPGQTRTTGIALYLAQKENRHAYRNENRPDYRSLSRTG